MTSSSSPPLLFFLLSSLFSFFLCSSSSSSSLVSREWFPMEGEVAWVVQVSDLHISRYHPDRADDLAWLLAPALRAIRPDLLLVTGDITDAKNRRRTSTRQDEAEWIQYRNTMDLVVRRGGIDKRRVFDIRGNHDKYGVPRVGSNLDFFSLYSVNSQLHRLANIHSISLMVSVVDSQGKETVSSSRPFSVEGKCAAEYQSTWLAFLVIGIRWEDLYSILLWSNICFLFILLSLPKILNIFMERSASYQKWAMSVSISSPIQQRRFLFSVLWFLIEGSMSRVIWLSLVVYLIYLLNFPWFWGYVSSENGDIAPMYMFGWRISSTVTMNKVVMIGNPDVMTVTLPFMYLVVTPLVLLIYSLFAERSAACLQCSFRKTRDSEQKVQLVAGAPLQSSEFISTSSVSRRTRRTFLLPACLVIACIHIRQCYSLMGAYGVSTVALSPAFSWVPPILLAAAICSTSKTW